jgi:cytochrome c oxidase assembly protein Cox11
MKAEVQVKTTKKEKPINLRKTIVTGVVYVLLAIILHLEAVPILQFMTRSASATGTVVDNEGISTYSPVVKFSTATGEHVRFKSWYSSKPAEFHVGDSATILYNPNNPHQAAVISYSAINLVCGVIFVFGLMQLSILLPSVRATLERNGTVFE